MKDRDRIWYVLGYLVGSALLAGQTVVGRAGERLSERQAWEG
jgi:hypothetical protein